MFFIDRLFMQQDHQSGGLPLVGRHVIERVDLETGESLPPSVNQKILEGSHSTKLTIRCDGYRVRVEGNPSRWQRQDNLFGLETIDECVEIYNHVLAKYDLPPFTKNTRLKHRQTPDGKGSSLVGNGAEITSIDWTQNLAVGKGSEQSFIRGMSSMNLGRALQPKLYPDGYSCYWGEGSEWLLIKLYTKAVELQRHRKKAHNVDEDTQRYIDKLITYCENNGVVRLEYSLRQKLLKRHNLQFYGLTEEQDFFTHIKHFEEAMDTITISHDEHLSVAQQLLQSGAVDTVRKANTTMNYFTLWQNGVDLRSTLNRSQFYEHKARLKKIGIDVGQQFDVTRMCPTLRRSKVIDVQSLTAPSWYQLPKPAQSNILPFKTYAA
ncbi:phage/plasmid replication protein, II/X family [Vibrio parahaemolyticus]|uniref:phage/plasmid replication protein, II/X family n=1 Tax=Vibrio harveyi group TaxID=717610 RepID=UPI00084B0CE2|nr:phage/plasmid replication protein, II/X family [Vibrio parahaemolyticus]AYO04454.1 hypothetical protein D0871_09260 [Vibrio parahaemolyticus]AYO04460.1 hypothetical protein D0871_09290 [Vibrio parahaemolyticus]EGQ9444808.1 hypothetical protein [Vibrio parahaemolyticus]EGR3368097.1 hypothetical protein [Vibrio parahaemolyticus]EHZ2907481.1 hypothetical protein [Vibrio parahaemolyticus]